MIRIKGRWVFIGLVATACGGGGGPTENRQVAAVEITTSAATLLVGQTSQFSAVPVDAGGIAISGAGAVTWASAGQAVATVTASGLVQALAVGSAVITATIQGWWGHARDGPAAGCRRGVTMPGNSFIRSSVCPHRAARVLRVSEPHNVIFQNKTGAPTDIQVTSRVTVARQFDVVGQFAYDCTLHPGMSGVVAVTP